jgi:iron uptake system EfeUOB component EfeO/EfeM
VPSARRATLIIVAAALLAVAVAIPIALSGGSGAKSCSSYPAPGQLAPGGTKVPAALAARYALFRGPQRAVDRVSSTQLASLHASGLITSGTRFVGDAAFGGRIYLVPAEHLLSMRLAPARCLSRLQRLIERESLSVLRSEYREAGLCILVVGGSRRQQECVPATGDPYALLSSNGTPGFGLAPDGVSAVTVSYWVAPPRTVAVHRNFFVILAPAQRAPPCGVQWLDPTGNVQRVVTGCSYLAPERRELSAYRTYVAGKLQTLQSEVAAMAGAIGAGKRSSAESAWLAAHLTWLQIGQDDGAYGAFGTLGGEIDGLASGHRNGTADAGFTGFHRIEFDLWSKRDLAAAAADTARLRELLEKLTGAPLASYLPGNTNGIASWLLRPHEVLEDALRDSLTADDDYGSGSDLASISADAAAVREMLSELAPELDPIAPHLIDQATNELNAFAAVIDPTRARGAGVPIGRLPTRERQQVDADLDAALETLAPLPDLITSTGRNSPTA